MDCRNSAWSLQLTHLSCVEKENQETSQKVHTGRVGCALPQQDWSKIARGCFLCSKSQNQNPKSLAAMPGAPNRAQQELAAAISKLRGNHYLWQLITMVIFQTQSNNLGAYNTANQAVAEPHKACRLWGERCTMKKHQSSVHFRIYVCHLDSTNCQEVRVSC